MQQTLPVAPFAVRLSSPEQEIHEVDERVLAELVRTRLLLERMRGWLLFAGIVGTVGAVVVLCLTVKSKVVLGVLGPLVASLPFSVGLVSDRVQWTWFRSVARGQGLSEAACKRLWDAAVGADQWIAVLTSCGRPPTDREIAQFVTSRGDTDHSVKTG